MSVIRMSCAAALGLAGAISAAVAGELTPPGPPESTVGPEARIPIFADDLPLTISTRGASHYLAETITFTATDEIAITVTERFVTIDLNGFALIGPGGIGGPNSIGIRGFSAAREVTIRNGTISGFGSDGILLGARGGVVEDLHVFDCGDDGIDLQGENGRVADCTVQTCDDAGIIVADGALVRDSIARGNGTGIEVTSDCVIESCVASSNVGFGLLLMGSSNVINCTASNNGDHGIDLRSSGTVLGCTASDNTGLGIRHVGSGAVIESCLVEGNTASGISANISVIVRRCSANSNGFTGISGTDGVFIDSCMANNNMTDGIEVDRNCTVINSMARFNGNGGDGAGIQVNQGSNRIEGNNVIGNDRGIEAGNFAGNIIVKNLASGIGQDDYGSVTDANALGPVQTNLTLDPGPWDNFAR